MTRVPDPESSAVQAEEDVPRRASRRDGAGRHASSSVHAAHPHGRSRRGLPRPYSRTLLIVILATLVLGAVLTGDRLGSSARAMEYGSLRTVAVAAAAPAEWLNHVLGIKTAAEAIRGAVLPHLLDDGTAAGPGKPRNAAEPTGSPDTSSTSTAEKPTGAAYRNPNPTAADPLKVLISGDSMTEAFGKYIRSDLIATGIAQATHDFRYSSGLARPDFFDWPTHLKAVMTEQDPDVVILMVGANDGQDIKVNGRVLKFGSDGWVEVYAKRVNDTMDLLATDGRRVYWIGQPIARSGTYTAKMQTLDGVYSSAAKGRDNVVYIDTWALFAARDGTYSAYLIGDDGEQHLMRSEDGIHLSVAGAHRLTDHVMAFIAKDYDLKP